MNKRNELSENIHKKLIKAMVKKLEKEGFTVQADHINHKNGAPEQYGGKIPDIFAKKNKHQKIIIEAETCDSIDSEDSKEQWQVFSIIPETKFWMIVPKKCYEKVKANLKKWGIYYDTIYYLDA